MLCMFVGGGGGCIDIVGRPILGGQEWLKNLSISEGMLRSFNSSMVIVLDGAHVSYVGCCVCSWRGCINLVGCPWWGKIEWLKSLNISERMLRILIHP